MKTTARKLATLFLATFVLLALTCVPCQAQHVPAPKEYPFSAIVLIQVEWPNKQRGTASGVLIDRFHVLTCAHAVYQSKFGGLAASLKVSPMQHGNEQPYGSAGVTKRRIYKEFTAYDNKNPGKTNESAKDIALLTLDRTIGDQAGVLSFSHAAASAFSGNASFTVVGYPGGKKFDGRNMYQCSGPIAGVAPGGGGLLYKKGGNIVSIPGMSGGPVWKIDAATRKPVVYAINVGEGNQNHGGVATRITKTIFDDLHNWRQSDPLPGDVRRSAAALDDFLNLGREDAWRAS